MKQAKDTHSPHAHTWMRYFQGAKRINRIGTLFLSILKTKEQIAKLSRIITDIFVFIRVTVKMIYLSVEIKKKYVAQEGPKINIRPKESMWLSSSIYNTLMRDKGKNKLV